jgi:hypothetical protein
MSELLWTNGPDRQLSADRDDNRPAIPFTWPSPMNWMRQRRVDRGARKVDSARSRLANRMSSLGKEWRVLDLKQSKDADPGTFLAVGPGGVFAVTIKDHGRSRISFAGDVVQVNGTRPRYVAEARKNAQIAADALSRQAGVAIPVMPVLAFAGSGTIVFYGMPKGCIVTGSQDLHKVLKARGRRLASTTVEKVFTVAKHPRTWMNEPYVALADRYRWYSDGGRAGADKPAAPR